MREHLWLAMPVIAMTLFAADAHASRLEPRLVAPVVAHGVRYEVPHFGALHGRNQNGGYVQAWDVATNKLLWDRMVYRVTYDGIHTACVQDVFITGIDVKTDVMVVTNEASEKFEMDLVSGRVRALSHLWGNTDVPTKQLACYVMSGAALLLVLAGWYRLRMRQPPNLALKPAGDAPPAER